MKLTQEGIERLKLPPGKDEAIYFDDMMPGFGVRVRAGGSKRWVIQYKTAPRGRPEAQQRAKQRRLTLGSTNLLTLKEAREKARKLLVKAADGEDPAVARNDAKLQAVTSAWRTFEAITERYLKWKREQVKPRTFIEIDRYLRVYWKPLQGRAIDRISRADIAAELTKMRGRSGPEAANHARAALSALFAWVIREGLCESNPVIGTEKPAKATARDRVLSDRELAEIWHGLPENDYGRIVKLLILTGSRREEIAGLRRSEIDFENHRLALPRERTKNGRPHLIPLTAAALSVLKAIPMREGRDLVFGGRGGGFSGWSAAKTALDAKLEGVAPWRLHDIRRTVATGMAELGIQAHIVEAVLNHVSGAKAGVAGVYNRAAYAEGKGTALELWGQHVTKVCAPTV
jgi:integrase